MHKKDRKVVQKILHLTVIFGQILDQKVSEIGTESRISSSVNSPLEVTWCPLGPSPSLERYFQNYKDIVRCDTRGMEVPGHQQEQFSQTLIGIYKNPLLFDFVVL